MEKEISAIICTLNRAHYLQKAISSLVNQDLPWEAYEILIVDNGSTDDTREVVDRFSGSGNIRYIHEPVMGLSHARNRGWREASAPYVAYLDDDAVAEPVWLGKIRQVFETMNPQPGCVGGKVMPIWEAPRPFWLGDDLLCSLTALDWSDSPHVIDNLNSEWLAGANIAFPKELLDRLGGFTPHLDRSGTRLLSSGDVFLEKQIQQAGYTCFYYPDVAVSHLIPASRLTRSWFMRRYYFQGVSDAAMQLLSESPSKKRRLRHASEKAITLLRQPGSFLNLLVSTKDPERFTRKCFNLITLGHVIGLLSLPHHLCHGKMICP